jgi:ubiquinone/menaquinone biosynthesis C-methylase UbiE
MRPKLKVAILAVIVVLAGLGLLPPMLERLHRLPVVPPGQIAEDQLSPERIRFMSPAKVVKLLNPQPASTLLDLGAGYGLFTFMLAPAVGENGTVFATDINPQALAALSKQALQKNLKNIVPVQVQADGFDGFYKQHLFDFILASDVIPLIREPAVFFDQLRSSLREGSGRLWVIDLRLDPDFTVLEFDHWISTENDSRRIMSQSNIMRRLSEESRQALNNASAANTPESSAMLVVEDLNRILEDPTLWPEIRAGSLHLNHRERKLRRYLLHVLDREGTFAEGAGATIPPKSRRALRLLNRLIIQDLLKTDKWERAFGLESMTWSRWTPLLAQIEAGHDYNSLLGMAGFELVQEHAALPYHRVWEFKRLR